MKKAIMSVLTVWILVNVGLFSLILLSPEIEVQVSASTIIVDDDGTPGVDCNYTTIQEGIDAANPGDTVFVKNGTYYENVVIKIALNLTGEDKKTTIIDGQGGRYTLFLNKSNYVNVSQFTVKNGTFGLYLSSSSNCNVIGNIIYNTTERGISLNHSNNNGIIDNFIHDVTNLSSGWKELYGLYLNDSSDNKIMANRISNLTAEWILLGISLSDSTNNTITENYINNLTTPNQSSKGIYLENSHYNNLSSNYIYNISGNDNFCGIYLSDSVNNTMMFNCIYNISTTDSVYLIRLAGDSKFNNLTSNHIYNINCLPSGGMIHGIDLFMASNNYVNSNCIHNMTAHRNSYGISSYKASNNTVISNHIYNLKGINLNVIGIQLYYYSHNNNIYSNHIHDLDADGFAQGILLSYYSNNSQIISNVIYNMSSVATSYGIRSYTMAFQSPAFNNSFVGNIIYNVKEGLSFSGINNYVAENQIYNITEKGIVVDWDTENSIVKSNYIDNMNGNGSKVGIYLANPVNNLFISNHLSNISSNNMDAYGIFFYTSSFNTTFINCTILNVKTYDFYLSGSHAIALNTTFNTSKVHFNDASSSLEVQWYLHVYVNDTHGKPVSGATIEIYNSTNDFMISGLTHSNGFLNWTVVTERIQLLGINITQTPHNISANISGFIAYAEPEPMMNKNKRINITLSIPYPFIQLKEGWNLISVPFIQEEQNLSKVLESIYGFYDAVQWYDSSYPNKPWKHHKVGKTIGNDLSELNESMGFWVHIINPGNTIFVYNGTQPTSNQTIALHPGWNMVGYPSLSNKNRTAALNDLTYGSEVDSIWTFNAATQTWEEIGAGDYFEVGRGYWIHATQECVWEVPL